VTRYLSLAEYLWLAEQVRAGGEDANQSEPGRAGAAGEVDESWLAEWLRVRVRFQPDRVVGLGTTRLRQEARSAHG
jgi:hypothetical protein